MRKVIIAKIKEVLYLFLLQKYNDKTETRIYGTSERTQLLYSRITGVKARNRRANNVVFSDLGPFNS